MKLNFKGYFLSRNDIFYFYVQCYNNNDTSLDIDMQVVIILVFRDSCAQWIPKNSVCVIYTC